MKKIYLPLLMLLAFYSANAQNKKVELRSSIGYLSDAHVASAVANGVGTIFVSIFSDHDFKIATSGIYSEDLLISLSNPHFQLSGSYVYERLKNTEYNNDKTTIFTRDMNVVLTGMRYNYVLKPNFRVYSGGEIGLRFNHYSGETDKQPITQFAYQIVASGIRYGKTFAGFTELGFGAKGWIHTGISVSF